MIDQDRPCPHENFEAHVEVTRITEPVPVCGDREHRHSGPCEVYRAAPEYMAQMEREAAVIAYKACIRVWCTQCGETFRWIGLQAGDVPNRPMVSVDESELRAPIRPASRDPDFGLGIPGFAIWGRPK